MTGLCCHDNYELHRGTEGRLLEGFLRPSLPLARVYRRAVGFFSSSVFEAAIDAFAQFFRQGGTMEVICSPLFSREDVEALRMGLYGDVRRSRSLDDVLDSRPRSRGFGLLAWALAERQLELRIAILEKQSRTAIYHEKTGLLLAPGGEVVAFDGSANESLAGYVANFERITVHRRGPDDRKECWANLISRDFERLWSDQTPGLKVLSLHEGFKRHLVEVRHDIPDASAVSPSHSPVPAMTVATEILRRPPRLELRSYQDEAIRCWFAHGGCGIYSMATGTGKTITALSTLEQLYRQAGGPLVIIVVAPYLSLVDQWSREAREFGLDPINCSGSSREWTALVDMALYLNQSGQRTTSTST